MTNGVGMKIAVVAPSNALNRKAAAKVETIVAARGDCDVSIHPQCFESDGHFAGSDAVRLAALREVMADGSVDAVWFARGDDRLDLACRIAAQRAAWRNHRDFHAHPVCHVPRHSIGQPR